MAEDIWKRMLVAVLAIVLCAIPAGASMNYETPEHQVESSTGVSTDSMASATSGDLEGKPAFSIGEKGEAVDAASGSAPMWNPNVGWGTPTLIETNDSGDAWDPQVAVDLIGDAIAVWSMSDGIRNNIWANRFEPGIGWGTAELIETDNAGHASWPQIGFDNMGNAWVVWFQSDGSVNNIWANRYVYGAGWSGAQLIEASGAWPQLAVTQSGAAIVAFIRGDGTYNHLYAKRYIPGPGWEASASIEGNSASTIAWSVAMNMGGDGVIVWSESVGWPSVTRTDIWANRRTQAGNWETATLVESNGGEWSHDPCVAMNEAGDAIAVWHQGPGSIRDIWSNRLPAGGGWGSPALLETTILDAQGPRIITRPDGSGVAMWQQTDGTYYHNWASRLSSVGVWAPAELIENDTAGSASGTRPALDSSGSVIAVWTQGGGTVSNISANRFVPTAGWGASALIETNDAFDALSPQIAMDSGGNAVVVWQQRSGSFRSIYANTYTRDSEPPVTTLDIGSPNYIAQNTYVTPATPLMLTASDGQSGVNSTYYSIWDGVWTPLANYASPFTLQGADGLRYIEFYSVDYEYNEELRNNATLYLDSSPPATTIDVGTPKYLAGPDVYVSSTTRFTLTAADSGGSGVNRTSYRLDQSPWMQYIVPFTVASPGFHTVYFYSLDNVSNAEQQKNASFFVDAMPPGTSIQVGMPSYGVNPVYVSSSTEFNLTAIEDDTAVESIWYRIDAGQWMPCTGNFTIPMQGPHTIEYNSTDVLGNAESTASLSLFVDDLAPSTDISLQGPSHASGGTTYITNATLIILEGTDGGSGIASIQYRIDSGVWSQYTAPFNIASSGTHTVEHFSEDNLGNVETNIVSDFFVDDSIPVTTIGIGFPSYDDMGLHYVTSSTRFNLNAYEDAGSGLNSTWFKIDFWPWYEYQQPFIVGPPGMHIIRFFSVDNVSNTESPGSLVVYVDYEAPSSTASLLGPTYFDGLTTYITGNTSVVLSSIEEGSGLRELWFQVDTGTPIIYSSPFTISGLGPHIIRYYGVDRLANTEYERTLDVFIDDSPPISHFLIDTPSVGFNPTYVSSSTNFYFPSRQDFGSGVMETMYWIDDGISILYTGAFTFSGLPGGTHTITYFSRDYLGNEEEARTIVVFLDDILPLADAGEDVVAIKGGIVFLDAHASSDDAGITNYTWTFSYRGGTVFLYGIAPNFTFEDLGDYHVTLVVTDIIGNTDSDTMEVRVQKQPGGSTEVEVVPSWVTPVLLVLLVAIILLSILYLRRGMKKATPLEESHNADSEEQPDEAEKEEEEKRSGELP